MCCGEKGKEEDEKSKSKMLGGPGHMVGPRTIWWRQRTSPELHLPFSCSQAEWTEVGGGGWGGTEGMRQKARRVSWREKCSIES